MDILSLFNPFSGGASWPGVIFVLAIIFGLILFVWGD